QQKPIVGHIPLLASLQGGVAAPIQKMLRSLLSGRSRGGFPFVFNRKTTPASRSAEASRHLFNRSATPPCSDARRGICQPTTFGHFFHSSSRAPTEFVACCLRHSFRLSRSRLGCSATKCTFRTSRRRDRSEAGRAT